MQGKCYYCGKELTERTIKRHMKNCSEMKKIIEDKIQNAKEVRDQFLISIKDKKNPGKYCIYISIDADLQLEHLDKFIRDIWIECCGHSSAFYIDKKEYSSNSDGQLKINIYLKDLLNVNQKFEYKYDFDLTTCLVLEVVEMIEISEDFNQIEIIARNNEEAGFCNSPRDGICKYEGNKNGEYYYLPQKTKKCYDNTSIKNSIDLKEILNQVDKALDYKVFNKQNLISMIREDYLKNSNVGKRYIKEFTSMFVIDKDAISENIKMLALEAQFRDKELPKLN